MLHLCGIAAFVALAGWMVFCRGALPVLDPNIEAGTEIEAAFFRAMSLPGGGGAVSQTPSETRRPQRTNQSAAKECRSLFLARSGR